MADFQALNLISLGLSACSKIEKRHLQRLSFSEKLRASALPSSDNMVAKMEDSAESGRRSLYHRSANWTEWKSSSTEEKMRARNRPAWKPRSATGLLIHQTREGTTLRGIIRQDVRFGQSEVAVIRGDPTARSELFRTVFVKNATPGSDCSVYCSPTSTANVHCCRKVLRHRYQIQARC